MNAECGWSKRQRHGMWVNKYLKVLKCWSNTWKALSSSLSWADVKVVRILRCFLFSVKTPSWPGYILYGRPAGENIMLLHSAIDLYLERKQRKQRPLHFPSHCSPFSRNGENHWGRRHGRSYEASLRRLWEIQISCWNLLPNSRNNFLRPRLSSAFYGKIKHSVSNLLLRNFLTPGWN